MERFRRGCLPNGFSENFVKKSALFVAKKATPLLLTTMLIAACGGGEKISDSIQLQSTPRPSESGALPNPENPFAVLEMPFSKDPKMAIQQGWTSVFDPKHHGIDFVKGDIDNSRTWKSFPVKAAADGKACANPSSREGNAVLITHSIGETPIGSTYYGHLQKSEKDIPQCSTGQTVSKHKGDKIGDAGSTGAQDQSWIHLHFGVNDADGNPIDPYGLEGERNIYPKPDFSDAEQKPCGPKALFTDCYPKGAVVAEPKDPIPPTSGQITSKEVSVKWSTFRSQQDNYEIKYPSFWIHDSLRFSGDGIPKNSIDSFEDKITRNSMAVKYAPVPPNFTTLDNYIKGVTPSDMVTALMKTKVAGIDAQTLQIDIPAAGGQPAESRYFTHFLAKDPSGSQLLWIISYRYPTGQIAKTDAELFFKNMLDSFKFIQSPKNDSVEKPVDQGWVRFRSINYPYQIEYPSGWTAQNNLWGQAIDIFKEETQGNFQTNINIFSEPVNSWVTSEDYANNLIVKYSQVGIQANIKDVDVMPGNLIRVAGQDTYFIFASTSAETNLFVNQDTISYSVVFVRDGKGWQITLTLASHADNDSFESTFNNFQKMLASFKFLQ